MRRTVLIMVTAFALGVTVAHAADPNAGKILYMNNCVACHGAKGQGGVGVKLAGDAAYWDAALFKRAVLTGVDDEGKTLKPVMPRWGTTGFNNPKGVMPTDVDLENIETYLQTLAPKSN